MVTADLRLTRSFNLGGLAGRRSRGRADGRRAACRRRRRRSAAWAAGPAAAAAGRRPADGDHGRIQRRATGSTSTPTSRTCSTARTSTRSSATSCRRSSARRPRPARPAASSSARRSRSRSCSGGTHAAASLTAPQVSQLSPCPRPSTVSHRGRARSSSAAASLAAPWRSSWRRRACGCGCSRAGAPARARRRPRPGVLAPYVEGHDSQPLRTLGRRSLDTLRRRSSRACRRALGTARWSSRAAARSKSPSPTPTSRAWRRLARGRRGRRRGRRSGSRAHALREAEPALRPARVAARCISRRTPIVNVPALTVALAAAAAVACGAELIAGRGGDGDCAPPATASPWCRPRRASRAPQVVLAAGAWSAALAPAGADTLPGAAGARAAAVPGARRPDRCATSCGPATSTSCRGPTARCSSAPLRKTSASTNGPRPAASRGLLHAAIALVPALADATFVEARRGLRPGSPDDLPYIGRSAVLPGLIYACGHYRNGALLAPLTAALSAARARRQGRRGACRAARRRAPVGCRLGRGARDHDPHQRRRRPAPLASLPGWQLAAGAIAKEFTFAGFPEAVAFVSALWWRRPKPPITIPISRSTTRRVRVTYSTHSAGGLTALDFAGAADADAVARALTAGASASE